MILYSKVWLDVVFLWAGTVWPRIRAPWICVSLYACAAYFVSDYFHITFGSEGRTILLSTMSFLLIFRANQAYARFWEGATVVAEFFASIREFVMVSLIYLRGGARSVNFQSMGGLGNSQAAALVAEDAFDAKAREMRVDIVRLAVALGVAFQLHTRIAQDGYGLGRISKGTKWRVDFDRLRLRQLLTEEEFQLLDGLVGVVNGGSPAPGQDTLIYLSEQFRRSFDQAPRDTHPPRSWPEKFNVRNAAAARLPVAVTFLLRETLYRNMNDAQSSQPWGAKDRFIPGLITMLMHTFRCFEMANQIIMSPLPLPYGNLCKTLLGGFLLSMPFFVDAKLGWFANTAVPALVALALLGVDAIATELENPFGEDVNDLDFLEAIHGLEKDALQMLRFTGDDKACARFCWKRVPPFVEAASCRVVQQLLAIRAFTLSWMPAGPREGA